MRTRTLVLAILVIGLMLIMSAATFAADAPASTPGVNLEDLLKLFGGGAAAAIVLGKLALVTVAKNTKWGKQRAKDINKVISLMDSPDTLEILEKVGTKAGRRELAIKHASSAISRNKGVLPKWIQIDSDLAAEAAADKFTKIWHDKITKR